MSQAVSAQRDPPLPWVALVAHPTQAKARGVSLQAMRRRAGSEMPKEP